MIYISLELRTYLFFKISKIQMIFPATKTEETTIHQPACGIIESETADGTDLVCSGSRNGVGLGHDLIL